MICRPLNCLFVHIPKAAGQSIEQFFMNRLELDWDADRDRVLLGDNPNPDCGTEKLAHLSATEYLECGYLDPQEFAALFKFSFVRNPWDRIVSEYRHVMPQFDMLHDSHGKLLVDFVGRYENLQSDFDRVCERLGITGSRLPHRNPSDKKSRRLRRWLRNLVFLNGESSKRHYSEFYDSETRAAVDRLYQRDIDTFGYRFEPG